MRKLLHQWPAAIYIGACVLIVVLVGWAMASIWNECRAAGFSWFYCWRQIGR